MSYIKRKSIDTKQACILQKVQLKCYSLQEWLLFLMRFFQIKNDLPTQKSTQPTAETNYFRHRRLQHTWYYCYFTTRTLMILNLKFQYKRHSNLRIFILDLYYYNNPFYISNQALHRDLKLKNKQEIKKRNAFIKDFIIDQLHIQTLQ